MTQSDIQQMSFDNLRKAHSTVKKNLYDAKAAKRIAEKSIERYEEKLNEIAQEITKRLNDPSKKE